MSKEWREWVKGLAKRLNAELIEGLFDAEQQEFNFERVLTESGLVELLEAGQEAQKTLDMMKVLDIGTYYAVVCARSSDGLSAAKAKFLAGIAGKDGGKYDE